jgi:hypothetical protein
MIDAPQRLRTFVIRIAIEMLLVAALTGAVFVGGMGYGYRLGIERAERDAAEAQSIDVGDDACWRERACCTLRRWPVETTSTPILDASPRVRAVEGSRSRTTPTPARRRAPKRYALASPCEPSPGSAPSSSPRPVSASVPASDDASSMWADAPCGTHRRHYQNTRQTFSSPALDGRVSRYYIDSMTKQDTVTEWMTEQTAAALALTEALEWERQCAELAAEIDAAVEDEIG